MIPRSLRMVSVCGAFGLAAVLLMPAQGRAAYDVAAGYDLFQTQAGTSFTGLGNLMGVPLGSYNFGGSVGVNNTYNTDTIIQRTGSVTGMMAGDTASTGVVMDALQLETVAPTSFNSGPVGNYFVTLQSARGGTASTGTISITWGAGGESGSFSSSIDVYFDIRYGSLTGSIVYSSDAILTSSGSSWSDLPPPAALTIPGADQYLSGVNGDSSEDFWPGTVTESEAGVSHVVSPATMPEPASILMLGMGTIGIGIYGWRRRVRAA